MLMLITKVGKQQSTIEIINTIDGAVQALTSGTADYFMWEFYDKAICRSRFFRRSSRFLPMALFCHCCLYEMLKNNL
jgi:hypothetical protein